MEKFLLGCLVVFLYYNQGNIRRGWHMLTSHHQCTTDVRQHKGNSLKIDVEVKEPTLEDLGSLGFNVKKQ